MRRVPMTAVAICFLALGTASRVHGVELSGQALTVSLDAADGYAIETLASRGNDTNFIAPRPEGVTQDRSPWKVWLRDAAGQQVQLTAADARDASPQLRRDELVVTWTGVASEACRADLTVTVTIRLPEGSAKSHWDIDVSGQTTGALWQVDFPRVFGIRSRGDDQMCVPYYWGRLIRQPALHPIKYSLVYPQPASMQFFAYWGTEDEREPELPSVEKGVVETGWSPDRSDAAGLYWATEDGDGFMKRFAIDSQTTPGQLAWHVEHIPSLDAWPMAKHSEPTPVQYSPSYQTVISTFTGDYHEAAGIYLDWAKDQAWCQRGPADDWPEQTPPPGSDELARWTPNWFREIGFWAKFYHEPAKVLPEWAAYRKWLRVPMASHYYRYNVARFDDNYPEHLPGDPYLLQGVRDARAMGVRPLPYLNGVIWDTDTQSWIRENGLAAAAKAEHGGIYPWDILGEIHAHMCPATEQWRAKMRETTEKLVWEHGMSGVYLDCLAATQALPCYDSTHGHTLRGGDYRAKGNRKLMFDLRKHTRRLDPAASFFTEEIGEQYLDVMDGYLTLDLMRSYCRPGEQVFPVFTAAYHPYTINFGCDAQVDMDEDAFAWQVGETFIWGEQPLLSTIVAKPPGAGDANSEFLRDVVQAYYCVGQRFLQGGAWRRIAVRPLDTKPGTCGLELAARPHTVAYEKLRNRATTWRGPAVMASAWEREGDLAVVLANITGEDQSAELTIRADKLGLPQNARLIRTWPQPTTEPAPADGMRKLTIPARSVAFYVLTSDAQRATATKPLLDTPWHLLTVEDSEFSPVEGPAGSLWACSDAIVVNEVKDGVVVAAPQDLNADGEFVVRQGKQARTRGPAAEGRGLPRASAEQPFMLVRRLPHTVDRAGDCSVLVVSGGDDHLLCSVLGSGTVRFAKPGLVAVTNGATGEAVRTVADGVTDRFETPGTGTYIVGYARLNVDSVAEALRECGALAERSKPLVDELRALAASSSPRALVAASRALWDVEQSLRDVPGALSPVSPLSEVHSQIQALAAASAGGCLRLTAEDDWLTPGAPKDLSLLTIGTPDLADRVAGITLRAVAPCAADELRVAPASEGENLGDGVTRYRSQVTLDSGTYVERMVPVLVSARVSSGGVEYVLTEVLHLEANRPFEVRGQTGTVTLVAGRTGQGEVVLRNWSPNDVQVAMSTTAPEGWHVAAEPDRAKLPALQDAKVSVQIAPPANASRGEYQVRCVADYSKLADTEVVAFLKVSLLESLVPFTEKAEEWAKPAEDNRARIRQRGKLAIFAAKGERIQATIRNIRVTQYTDTLPFRLLDPDLKPIAEGRIPVDEERVIEQVAAATGTHYLEVTPGSGSADIEVANRCMAEVATKEDPLHLFCSRIERHFFVPADSTGFRIGAVDGGPDETAHFVVTAPTGRIAYEANGNYSGTEVSIAVRPDEAGEVWTLLCEPRQDVHFWLDGGVCPYLSTARERVLVPAHGDARGN